MTTAVPTRPDFAAALAGHAVEQAAPARQEPSKFSPNAPVDGFKSETQHARRQAWRDEPATDAQRGFLRKLLAERAGQPEAEAIRARINEAREARRLTKVVASQAITDLKALPRQAARTEPVQQELPGTEASGERISSRVVAQVGESILEGTYTIVFEGGEHENRTLRVRRQSADDKFMPGVMLVGFLSGRDNENDFTNFGHVLGLEFEEIIAPSDTHRGLYRGTPTGGGGQVVMWKKHADNEALAEAVKVLVADPLAAAKAYGLRSKRCGICNRKLSVESSIKAGIGPVCAGRL